MSLSAIRPLLPLWLATILVVSSSGCTGYVKCRELAEDAAGTFQAHFDASNFEAIADAAHPRLFEATSREELLELLASMRSQTGHWIRSELQSWNVNVDHGTTNVALVYVTEFENATTQETFGMLVEANSAYMVNWNITTNFARADGSER